MSAQQIQRTGRCLALLLGALLAGCADSRQAEVAEWMASRKAMAVPKVQPLAEPGVFHPLSYQRGSFEDPFAFEKLARVLHSSEPRQDRHLIERHLQRDREPLEAYPLDTIAMVGFLQRGGRPTALLSVDGHLYQVTTGAYIGPNNGEIKAISELQLQLLEVVQDAAGDWVERSSVIELRE